jgi:hypothetical protein
VHSNLKPLLRFSIDLNLIDSGCYRNPQLIIGASLNSRSYSSFASNATDGVFQKGIQACLGGRSPQSAGREANFGGRACVRRAGVH